MLRKITDCLVYAVSHSMLSGVVFLRLFMVKTAANRGLRGGTYNNNNNLYARALRSAYRNWNNPPNCNNNYGGRLYS